MDYTGSAIPKEASKVRAKGVRAVKGWAVIATGKIKSAFINERISKMIALDYAIKFAPKTIGVLPVLITPIKPRSVSK